MAHYIIVTEADETQYKYPSDENPQTYPSEEVADRTVSELVELAFHSGSGRRFYPVSTQEPTEQEKEEAMSMELDLPAWVKKASGSRRWG